MNTMQQTLLQLTGVDQLIPVHGIEGAKSYPMGTNCRTPLFDDEKDVFYIKTTDANGFPSIKAYKFEEIILVDENANGTGVSLDSIRSIIKEELSSIKEELINGQQSVSEPVVVSTADVSDDATGISNGSTKLSNGSTSSAKPKYRRPDYSNVESGKEQQQSTGNNARTNKS